MEAITAGKRLNLARRRNGMSQRELASRLGKSVRTIQRYEKDELELSPRTAAQLAQILGTTQGYLLGYAADSFQFGSMADLMAFLFGLEQAEGVQFRIETTRDSCALVFPEDDGQMPQNRMICGFLREWENKMRYPAYQKDYEEWKAKTLYQYSDRPLVCRERPVLSEEEEKQRVQKEWEDLLEQAPAPDGEEIPADE